MKSFSEPETLRDGARRSMIASLPLIITGLTLPFIANAAGVRTDAAKGYLIEPTEEFNEELALTAALTKKQAAIRQDWDKIVARFEASEKPEDLASTIKEMREFLVKIEGVPAGFTRREMVKKCRIQKFIDPSKRIKKQKPTWTTPVEIEYQAFVKEINKQLTPEKPGKEVVF